MMSRKQVAIATTLWVVETAAGPLVLVALAYWSWTLAGKLLHWLERVVTVHA
jgi:hypothetical protein